MVPVEIVWDDERGAIFLKQTGALGLAEAQQLLPRLGPLLERSRARNGHALMLVDVRGLPEDALAALQHQRGGATTTSVLRADDRVAVLVSTSLVKSNFTRTGSSFLTYAFFLSSDAAEMWLFAYRHALSA